MRAVIQRTLKSALVRVNSEITGQISKGLIVYLGIEAEDSEDDIQWIARKIVNMRIFSDDAGKMNLSLNEVKGGLLVISQFTLFASTKKGNRPSYLRSAKPEFAEVLYNDFLSHLSEHYPSVPVGTGIFGADMKVEYINDGPITIIVDTKNKE